MIQRIEIDEIQLLFKDFIDIDNKLYTENEINSRDFVYNFDNKGYKCNEYNIIGNSIHTYKKGCKRIS